jgi:hypothetical protein
MASRRNGAFFMSRVVLLPLAASQGSMISACTLGRAGTGSPLIVWMTDHWWSQLMVKVDSVAALLVPAIEAIRAPKVQAPWVAGGGGGGVMQGPQVVRRQSSTTETSVMNSSFAGSTVQAERSGSAETSRLERTAACWSVVPTSERNCWLGVTVAAYAIREALRASANRARTSLGFRCERRRLMLPPSWAKPPRGSYRCF